MSMRVPRTRAQAVSVDLRAFGWDRFVMASLRHATLPWSGAGRMDTDLEATSLSELGAAGSRDKLSLTGQFAAHQSLLRFAGVPDSRFDAGDWAVAMRRGCDARLLRIRATQANSDDDTPPLSLIESFARAIDAPPLSTLHLSWARPEAVFQEVILRLTADATADLRWLRESAWGSVAAPGPPALKTAFLDRGGRYTWTDPATVDSLSLAAGLGDGIQLVTLGGPHASPLQRFSAIAPLLLLAGTPVRIEEGELAERVAPHFERGRFVLVVTSPQSFDGASRRVVQILSGMAAAVWIVPEEGRAMLGGGAEPVALPESRFFVAAPGAVARRHLDDGLRPLPLATRAGWLGRFVMSGDYLAYLERGTVPHESIAAAVSLEEPRRSYLAALALLGPQTPVVIAEEFLRDLGCTVELQSLLVAGVVDVVAGELCFLAGADEDIATLLPAESRSELSLRAAERALLRGDVRRSATLLIDGGDSTRALSLLEEAIGWGSLSADEVVATLDSLPRAELGGAPVLAERLASALVDCGRYSDAVQLAAGLPDAARAVALARAERRTGEYTRALARLDELPDEARGFEAELLRAELRRLQGLDARPVLARCHLLAESDAERLRLSYEETIYSLEKFEHAEEGWLSDPSPTGLYLVSRYCTYRATDRDDREAACAHAASSLALARTATERIDASLDQLFALFLSGRWDETRRAALMALSLVEETQGDRAAGGILFTLAYLCADSGQWSAAAQRIERLAAFYTSTGDRKRLLEIALLEAHLAFCRGRFAEAKAHAARIAGEPALSLQLREAANLILDECDWIDGALREVRSSGDSRCVELTDRHSLNVCRAEGDMSRIEGAFTRELALWEQNRLANIGCDPPAPRNASDKLKLFRSACGISRRLGDGALRTLAARLGEELGVSRELLGAPSTPPASDIELRALRAVATREFPFRGDALDEIAWRFATRNRLGHWSESGSLPPLDAALLDSIAAAGAPGWVECGERELLFIEGLDSWSPPSRDAIRALFRTRSEHYRLGRLTEQRQAMAQTPPESIDGVIGESQAMKEAFALIARVSKRDVPVCITGESGTGKELIARAVHRHSPRRGKPFTAVNCAALPENLIESELFGHVRGAFTGADRDRAGLIETSDGGTLFLDEIGEMPLTAQAKLLRFLQEGEFRRVGDTVNRSADVRIVSATNRKLERAVDDGAFREDLYYRIRGVEIALPPLRDRLADIPLLALTFLQREHEKHRSGPRRLSDETEAVFLSYGWPGNVRELQNTIRAAHAIAGDAAELELDHLPERLRQVGIVRTSAVSYHDEIVRFRKSLIERSLKQVSGNQNQAARLLGMSRQALAYQIRELGIMVRERA
jgi:DNA-binding NtrC family response regulator